MSSAPQVEIMGYDDPVVNAMRQAAVQFPGHNISHGREATVNGAPGVLIDLYLGDRYVGTVEGNESGAPPEEVQYMDLEDFIRGTGGWKRYGEF